MARFDNSLPITAEQSNYQPRPLPPILRIPGIVPPGGDAGPRDHHSEMFSADFEIIDLCLGNPGAWIAWQRVSTLAIQVLPLGFKLIGANCSGRPKRLLSAT
ncbi:hypothetical protein CEXT_143801 [Caerostris extrusa]|uniref:Uncharacterized protein n=1 Tax=Caerostris extrusa TaxID=172846 RepID=A0AAV4Y1N3_CAEEX|nr:hypothetical protein CEXT_143801 [Caerostris extrusa]